MDGERETDITPPNNLCSASPSLSKISKVGKSILFGLLDHCRVHHSHPHCTGHSHVHPHPHHALIGDHSHPHAHHSPRVCHGVHRGSDCCRSKAHDRKSLGEKVARCLVSWKWQKKNSVTLTAKLSITWVWLGTLKQSLVTASYLMPAQLLLSPCWRALRVGWFGLGGCMPAPRKSRLMSTEWSDQVDGRDGLAAALWEAIPCRTGCWGIMSCGCRGPPMLWRGW